MLSFVLVLLSLAASTVFLFLEIHRRKNNAALCRPFPPCATPKERLKRSPLRKDIPEEADVIIIGSGPSGLALGVLLRRRGYRVVVFEQHDVAGGGLHSFVDQGFEFDTGFHYVGEMTAGKELKAIMDTLTGGAVAYHSLHECPYTADGVYDKVVFAKRASNGGADGDSAKGLVHTVRCGKAEWQADLLERFPLEREGLLRYFRTMAACGKTAMPSYIWRSLPEGRVKRWLYPSLGKPQREHSTKGFADLLDE